MNQEIKKMIVDSAVLVVSAALGAVFSGMMLLWFGVSPQSFWFKLTHVILFLPVFAGMVLLTSFLTGRFKQFLLIEKNLFQKIILLLHLRKKGN